MFGSHEKDTSGTSGIPGQSAKEVLQQQPLQQHEGVILPKDTPPEKETKTSVQDTATEDTKSFLDWFHPCGEGNHGFPPLGHPVAG